MPLPREQEMKMDAAAKEFDRELRALYNGFTGEQKQAVNEVIDLIEDHYMEAAYDRICKKLRHLRRPIATEIDIW
jgi:cell division septum initiation protein DivIVA